MKRSQGLVENPRPTLRFSTSLVMSFTTVLDFCVLNFCSEDGGVKEGGRGGVEGGLAGRVVLAVGLVLAGGVVLAKSGRVQLLSALRTHRRELVC